MIDQQILDYIKQRLAQDTQKDDIKKELSANGWQEQDIEEAFATYNSNIPNQQLVPPPPSPVSGVTNSLPGVIDLLKESFVIYKSRFAVLLKIAIIPALCFLAIFLLSLGITYLNNNISIILTILLLPLSLASILPQFWSQIALIFAIKDSPENIDFKESYRRAWHKIGSYFWVGFLGGFITMGGFFLFVVPGIIFSIWFSFGSFILIAEDQKGMNALLKSKEYVKGKWWGVFWRFLAMGLIFVLIGLILAPLFFFLKSQFLINFISWPISLFLGPFVLVYSFLIYKYLKTEKGDFVFEPKKKGLFIFFAILGFILIPIILTISVLLSLN